MKVALLPSSIPHFPRDIEQSSGAGRFEKSWGWRNWQILCEIVANRGFGDQKLYKMLTEELYFDYVIRFRGNIAVTAACGRSAAAWVQGGGRARVLRGAAVTADRYPVATVVRVQDPDMKQAWCLAASSTAATAKQLTGLYGRRWGIECTLRDTKDLRFAMGLGTIHVNSPGGAIGYG